MTHTSTEQPEALRLADRMPITGTSYGWMFDAEEMIRRQHAEIDRLRKVLSALIAGYEDTECTGMMDMMVIGEDVQEAVRLLGITQEKQG